MNNFWTKEDELKLISLCGKYSFNKLIEFFPNRTRSAIHCKSAKMGLKSGYRSSKYTINKNYWKILDIEKCYYAGMIGSDGCLTSKGTCLKFNLNIKDLQFLENFKLSCEFSGEIKYKSIKVYKNDRLMDVCLLEIWKIGEWYKDLKELFNITPRKSLTLIPPNISNKYLNYSYLLGLLDGDGSILINRADKRVSVGIVGASLPLIEWVKSQFNNIINNNYNIVKPKNCNYYILTVRGKEAAVIIDFLRQFPVPKLARKWDKPEVLERINKYKSERPDLFKTLNPNDIAHLLPPIKNIPT